MKHRRNNTILVVICLLLLLQFIPSVNGMFTIIPSTIQLYELNKGQVIEREILVYNLQNNSYTLTIQGIGEANNWIKLYSIEDHELLYPLTNITLPGKNSEKNSITLKAIITIPENAANDIYLPNIEYIYNPPSTQSMGIGFTMSTNFVLEVIGVEKKSGIVRNIAIDQVIEIGKSLNLYVQFDNDGNVIAKPQINVKILREGKIVDNFTYSDTPVEPKKRETIQLSWDTSIGVPENYTAQISVYLDEEKLHEENLSFQILPYGSLTSGELFNLSYAGSLSKDKTIKLIGDFRNAGSYVVTAKFVGEIYKEGDLIEIIESPEYLVPAWNIQSFESFFTIPEEGIYTIKGYVLYSGKQTNSMTIDIQVGNFVSMEILLLGLIVIICIGFSLYLLKYRDRSSIKKFKIGFTRNSFALPKKKTKPEKIKKSRIKVRKNNNRLTKKKSVIGKNYDDIERIVDEF